MFRKNSIVTVSLFIGLMIAIYACQPAGNTNSNANTNANVNAQPANANTSASSTTDASSARLAVRDIARTDPGAQEPATLRPRRRNMDESVIRSPARRDRPPEPGADLARRRALGA